MCGLPAVHQRSCVGAQVVQVTPPGLRGVQAHAAQAGRCSPQDARHHPCQPGASRLRPAYPASQHAHLCACSPDRQPIRHIVPHLPPTLPAGARSWAVWTGYYFEAYGPETTEEGLCLVNAS